MKKYTTAQILKLARGATDAMILAINNGMDAEGIFHEGYGAVLKEEPDFPQNHANIMISSAFCGIIRFAKSKGIDVDSVF